MFKKLPIIFMLAVIFSLAGCLPMNTDYDQELFLQEKRSVVVVRSFIKNEDEPPNKLNTVWDNQDTGYFFSTNNTDTIASYRNGVDNYYIHSIQPGRYIFRKGIAPHLIEKKSLFSDDLIPVGTSATHYYLNSGDIDFEVKPNEVVYLGDFVLKGIFTGDIEIRDSYYAAEAFLKKKHPELASRLKKNLIKIPHSVKFHIPKFWQEVGETFKRHKLEAKN